MRIAVYAILTYVMYSANTHATCQHYVMKHFRYFFSSTEMKKIENIFLIYIRNLIFFHLVFSIKLID